MRLIDADTLKDECEAVYKRMEKLDDGIFSPAHYELDAIRAIIRRIENQPTRRADGTVEDGYWIKGFREWANGRKEDVYWCSQCKGKSKTKLTHCQYCGATMNADRKTENSEIPNNCEACEHWSDPEDGCADRHGCKDEPQTAPYIPIEVFEDIMCYKDETQKNCKTCKFHHEEWFGEECDSCCEYSDWQPKDEPQTERSE